MPPANRTHRLGEIVLDDALLAPLLNTIRQVVQSVVAGEMVKLHQSLEAREAVTKAERAEALSAAVTTGVEVSPADKFNAADFRTALLLGKLPDDAGLLIDTKSTAMLLNISPRMLYRLHQVQAVPEPVRLGRLVRWRLAEIIEWVDSDCPPRRSWRYCGRRSSSKKPSR